MTTHAVEAPDESGLAEPIVGETDEQDLSDLRFAEFASELQAVLAAEVASDVPSDLVEANVDQQTIVIEPATNQVQTSDLTRANGPDATGFPPADKIAPPVETLISNRPADHAMAANSGWQTARNVADPTAEIEGIQAQQEPAANAGEPANANESLMADPNLAPGIATQQVGQPIESDSKQEVSAEPSGEPSEHESPRWNLTAGTQSESSAQPSVEQNHRSLSSEQLRAGVATLQMPAHENALDSSATDKATPKPIGTPELFQSALHANPARTVENTSASQPAALTSAPLASQVAEHLVSARQSIHNGTTELEVTLDPPELGRITIELTESNDLLRGKLLVSETTTLETIRESIASILDSLANAGLSFDNLQLESSPKNDSNRDREASELAGQDRQSPGSITSDALSQPISSTHSVNILA